MSIRNILLIVRNPSNTAKFFVDAIGLTIKFQNESLIQLSSSNNDSSIPIVIREAMSASQLSTGYAPFLTFNVLNMENCITNAISLGAVLDGPIKYPAQGKFAAIRSPDGHMIGLFEAA